MRLAIVTGADCVYFDLMLELLRTLSDDEAAQRHALCVLDFGLTLDQVVRAQQCRATVIRPDWVFEAPAPLRTQANLGYATRPVLPRLFPGYDMYLWLDADISVPNARFMSTFTAAAKTGSLAIAEEADRSYRLEAYAFKWQLGNAFRCFGLRGGLNFCMGRPVNSGIFALKADAPHWSVWQARYQQAVHRAGRVNLDQHALMAALYLDKLPCTYLDSTHNWICTRSQPLWDEERQIFCRPYPPYDAIDVLHLAGRDKDKLWDIKTRLGETRRMHLTYSGRRQALLEQAPKIAAA